MKDRLIKIFATFFFIGYLPVMPGTFGSLAGVSIYLALKERPLFLFAAFAVTFFGGLYASSKAEVLFSKKDDGRIVIDEVCGMLLLYLLIPSHYLYTISGFVLYRLFDVIKPAPLARLEKLPSGWGIMADDILAALYSFMLISAWIILKRVVTF